MLRSLCIFIVLSAVVVPARFATAQDHAAAVEVATEAAGIWLALVDSARYDASWQEAAPVVQEALAMLEWESALEQVRQEVGALRVRRLGSSEYRTSLPNAPAGDYVVLQFATSFEDAPDVVELVVMMQTDDGWRAAGYRVVPAQDASP